MESVVQRLARSPRLGLIYHELDMLWQREVLARQAFYDGIADGVKTEFINGEIIMHSPRPRRPCHGS